MQFYFLAEIYPLVVSCMDPYSLQQKIPIHAITPLPNTRKEYAFHTPWVVSLKYQPGIVSLSRLLTERRAVERQSRVRPLLSNADSSNFTLKSPLHALKLTYNLARKFNPVHSKL